MAVTNSDRIAQIQEALAVYAESLIEFYDQTEMEKKHFRVLVEAARDYASLLESIERQRVV